LHPGRQADLPVLLPLYFLIHFYRRGLRRSSDFRQITELNLNGKSFILHLKERTFDGDKKENIHIRSYMFHVASEFLKNAENYEAG
jgi:hypothetical protein